MSTKIKSTFTPKSLSKGKEPLNSPHLVTTTTITTQIYPEKKPENSWANKPIRIIQGRIKKIGAALRTVNF